MRKSDQITETMRIMGQKIIFKLIEGIPISDEEWERTDKDMNLLHYYGIPKWRVLKRRYFAKDIKKGFGIEV